MAAARAPAYSALASMMLLPKYRNGLATGNTNCGVPLPIVFGYGLLPKSRELRTAVSPLYQTPSCEVPPWTTSGEGAKPVTVAASCPGVSAGPERMSFFPSSPPRSRARPGRCARPPVGEPAVVPVGAAAGYQRLDVTEYVSVSWGSRAPGPAPAPPVTVMCCRRSGRSRDRPRTRPRSSSALSPPGRTSRRRSS